MFTPASTYLAAYLDMAEVRGETLTSRQGQRRERQLEADFGTTWRRFSLDQPDPETVIKPHHRLDLLVEDETATEQQVRRLLSLAGLPENWDGSGSARASAASAKWARAFLEAIGPSDQTPTPALHANGHALLLYGPDPYAEIEFTEDGHIIYYAQRGTDHIFSDEDEKFDGEHIPTKLRAIGL